MLDTAHWQFSPYVLPILGIGLTNALLAIAAWRRRFFPGATSLSILLGAVAFWTLLNALEKSLVDLEAKLVVSTLQYLFITIIPTAWFVFGARFADRDEWIRPWVLALLGIEPAIVCLGAATDPWFGFLRSRMELVEEGGTFVLAVSYGPLFWIHAVYAYALYLLGSFLIVRGVARRPGWRVDHMAVMIAAMALPAIANAAYVFGVQPVRYINLTPLYLGVTTASAFWMLFHVRLFDVRPIARALVLERMDEPMLVLDTRRRLVDANAAARPLLVVPIERLRGLPIDEAAPWLAVHVPVAAEHQPPVVEIRRHEEGGQRVFELHVVPLRDARRPVGWLLHLSDVTARVAAEEERRRLEEALARTQKFESLAVMAGGVAHDFNNLLAVIIGNAELARDEAGVTPRTAGYLAQVVRAAESAAHLTAQMLAFSGHGRVSAETVALNELARQMSDLLKAAVPRPGVLELDLAAQPLWVAADRVQLRQVLMNLVVNASDALMGEAGFVRVRVRPASVTKEDLAEAVHDGGIAPGSVVLLEVADTGTGMDAKTKARVFDPFFSTKFTGRGLGLAVVLGVVRAHRGAILIHSEPGMGSEFRILFPMAEAPPAAIAAGRQGGLRLEAAHHKTVLVVDDEPDVLRITSKILQLAGFEVIEATSGIEALATFERQGAGIDVVVLDVTMPGLGGSEVFDRLRRLDPRIGILLTSGFDEGEVLATMRPTAPYGFLSKPFHAQELVAAALDLVKEARRLASG